MTSARPATSRVSEGAGSSMKGQVFGEPNRIDHAPQNATATKVMSRMTRRAVKSWLWRLNIADCLAYPTRDARTRSRAASARRSLQELAFGHVEELAGLRGHEPVEAAVAFGDLEVGVGPVALLVAQLH